MRNIPCASSPFGMFTFWFLPDAVHCVHWVHCPIVPFIQFVRSDSACDWLRPNAQHSLSISNSILYIFHTFCFRSIVCWSVVQLFTLCGSPPPHTLLSLPLSSLYERTQVIGNDIYGRMCAHTFTSNYYHYQLRTIAIAIGMSVSTKIRNSIRVTKSMEMPSMNGMVISVYFKHVARSTRCADILLSLTHLVSVDIRRNEVCRKSFLCTNSYALGVEEVCLAEHLSQKKREKKRKYIYKFNNHVRECWKRNYKQNQRRSDTVNECKNSSPRES